MKLTNANKLKIVIFSLCFFLASFTNQNSALAQPTSSTVKLTYNGLFGNLTISNTFNKKPSSACTFKIVGSVSYDGASTAESVRTLLSKRISAKQFSVKVYKLPAVLFSSDGDKAQLNIQTSFRCGSSTALISKPKAVRVVCGDGFTEVSPRTFLVKLSQKLAVYR